MSRQQDVIKACEHINRRQPDRTITEDMQKQIEERCRTLPTFEHSFFELSCVKYYSLERNELLKCRWRKYKDIDRRVFEPFFFPDHRDVHFHNGTVRFNPSLSKFRQTDHRIKLRCGPGVDKLGQLPIPAELQMKRGIQLDEEKVKKKTHKGKKKEKRIKT